MMLLGKEFEFIAAHKLRDNIGAPMHTHRYKLRITCYGEVNKKGKVLETKLLEESVNNIIIKKLNNCFLNDFIAQPTMENIILFIYEELKDLNIYEIKLWENNKTFVCYKPQNKIFNERIFE